ncbi:MAG TPA: glycosyltransferase family 4 protein [Spirochaetia bacterium]|nr:glycosyltransferase family 4 protein [Spirochaetia bacterium]
MSDPVQEGRSLSVGFISTRFKGLDGVSLEAAKWASSVEEFGHKTYWFAGELDRNPDRSMLVPEAFFGHPSVEALTRALFSSQKRSRMITDALHSQKDFLKDKLYEFIDRFDIDLIIPENALSIPMHLPLGMAITDLIAETGIPTIAHHHDFSWERSRFLSNACQDILNMAFPPDLPSIRHVVISSVAQAELAARRSVAASVVFNVMDFEKRPPRPAETDAQFRADMGFDKDDLLILQPTRVVQHKGIEQAVSLVQLLNLPKTRLIVSHSMNDEGPAYADWLEKWAARQGVGLHFVHDRVEEEAPRTGSHAHLHSLREMYEHADLVTYPSTFEGFGNAFLEAIFYRKPILVNRYPVFIVDIESKGFDVITIDGFLTDSALAQVKEVLTNPERRRKMVERNLEIARKHFSYQILRKELASLISSFFGIAPPKGLFGRLFRWG